MKKYTTILALLSISFYLSAQYSWINKNPFGGTASRNGAAFVVGNTAIVVGGITGAGPTYTNQVWAYTPSTDSWSQKSNYPIIIAGSSSFVVNDTGYIIGGQNNSLSLVSNVYAYNPGSDSWEPKANYGGGIGDNAATFTINGIGYVVTGALNSSNASVTGYAYTPSTNTWSQIADYIGPATVNPVGFAIDSFGYVGLGGNGSGAQYNQFYKYDPSTNAWSAIAAFPGVARMGAVAFVIGGIAYVGSGTTFVQGTSSTYTLGDFYAYDPSSDTWTAVPGIPGSPRMESTAFTMNANGYVVGGYDYFNQNYFNLVNEFGTCGTIAAVPVVPGGGKTHAIEIYPNPAADGMVVKINGEINAALQYDVTSVDGKRIKSQPVNQSQFELNTSGLASGVYILTIKDNEGIEGVKRFEVIH